MLQEVQRALFPAEQELAKHPAAKCGGSVGYVAEHEVDELGPLPQVDIHAADRHALEMRHRADQEEDLIMVRVAMDTCSIVRVQVHLLGREDFRHPKDRLNRADRGHDDGLLPTLSAAASSRALAIGATAARHIPQHSAAGGVLFTSMKASPCSKSRIEKRPLQGVDMLSGSTRTRVW